MPASGSIANEMELSSFYAEDDRISVPTIIGQKSSAGAVPILIVDTGQAPATSSPTQLLPIAD